MATFKKIPPKKKLPVTLTVTGELFPLEREIYVSNAFKQTFKLHTFIASTFTNIQLISHDIKNIFSIQNMGYPAESVPLLMAWADAFIEHLTVAIKALNACGDLFNILQDTISIIVIPNPTRNLTITAETVNSYDMIINDYPIANIDKHALPELLLNQITSKLKAV